MNSYLAKYKKQDLIVRSASYRERIIIDDSGSIHTVLESLYQEISEAIQNGKGASYLTHPDGTVRLAARKLQQRRKEQCDGY